MKNPTVRYICMRAHKESQMETKELRDTFQYFVLSRTNYRHSLILTHYFCHVEALMARIESFQQWLAERPEKVIVVVGHSNFFKYYLRMSDKLRNCEVHKFTM